MITKKYRPEIQEIHDKANGAFEEIINEANKLINMSVEEKGNRLEKVGFKNNPEVKKAKEAKRARELKELVDHYNFHYPQNKFIDQQRVDEICEKYDLYVGPIVNYIGFVPEFALEDIEAFKIRPEDSLKTKPGLNQVMEGFNAGRSIAIDIIPIEISLENDIDGFIDRGGFVQRVPGPGLVRVEGYFNGPLEFITELDKGLQIIAPERDFQFQNKFKTGRKLIEDPIVLHPVEGGFLIVTAWGDEAKEVQNPNKN